MNLPLINGSSTAVRQLANQNYNICFRTELIDRQPASAMHCLTPCNYNTSATDAPYVSLTGSNNTLNILCRGADYLSTNQMVFSPGNDTYFDIGVDRVCGGVAAGTYYGFCSKICLLLLFKSIIQLIFKKLHNNFSFGDAIYLALHNRRK